MRIVSSFHDYYDRALAHGHDDRLVFVRESQSINRYSYPKPVNPDFVPFASLSDALPGGLQRTVARNTVHSDPFEIVMGGKTYRGVATDVLDGNRHRTLRVSYSADDLNAHLVSLGIETDDRKAGFFERTGHLTRFLAAPSREVPLELLAEKRVALLLVRSNDVVINPSLKALEFFRRMTATEVFQELEMFLGGVLAPENRPMVAIEDKYRIAEHGFDRYSFRRPPRKRQSRA